MSDKPEPLSAILAEMRAGIHTGRADIIDIVNERLIAYADRIEAAAERERAITDIMLAVKDKPLPHPDPDNAPPLFFPMTKTQLQTLSDLVAIAHDEMDGLPRHEQELERFDSLLFDMKARYAFDKPYASPGNAAAMREALGKLTDAVRNYFGWDDAPAVQDRDDPTAYFCAEMSAAIAALAAPARNCDRTECADVESAWATYCTETNRADCKGFARWLFATAKGGAE